MRLRGYEGRKTMGRNGRGTVCGAFNGSGRKDGNTAILLETVMEELAKEGIATELVQLAGHPVTGCTACRRCFERVNRRCAVEGDIVNECIEKMIRADGMLLGSPVYYPCRGNEGPH